MADVVGSPLAGSGGYDSGSSLGARTGAPEYVSVE